ncbi:MAG: DUF1553 domain-containing protein [Planctomycetaceae bacterium]|nr:DUF1553 domain-containing protein [Planctomycetaceae bacterium]
MMQRSLWKLPACMIPLLVLGLPAAALQSAHSAEAPTAADTGKAPIEFVDDVQPILAQNCYHCHGQKKREGGLRLDSQLRASRGGDSGPAWKSGHSSESLLILRITSDDEKLRMPLDAEPLAPDEIATLKRWIDAGARWPEGASGPAEDEHWSFRPPRKPALPAVKDEAWVKNPIDRFVLARLEAEGLRPSAQADRYTLARRLSLDLIGLPPTPQEVDDFVGDQRPDAYEQLVDRLLLSPHYGERWARRWLDLARYADTNGYEKDRPRSIWPYRNWVIDALNSDMPFDQYTIEQIAGDMLPGATVSQRTATGFHRNTMLNEEGGIDPEEDRFKRIVDRVGTTGATWLGLTLACAQCHSHKYDPITQREFYAMYALLNNANELEMPVPDSSVASRRSEVDAQIVANEADLENRFPVPAIVEWEVARPVEGRSASGAVLVPQSDGSFLASGANPETDVYTIVVDSAVTAVVAIRLEVLTDPSLPNSGPGRAENGNFVVSELEVSVAGLGTPDRAAPLRLRNAQADFSQDNFAVAAAIDGDKGSASGWAIFSGAGPWNVNRTATFDVENPLRTQQGARITLTIHQQLGRNHNLGRFRISVGQPVDETRPVAERRHDLVERRFARWQSEAAIKARKWTVLQPATYQSNAATLTLLDDSSVLAGGDATKRDVFELECETAVSDITALRVDALLHPGLPGGGPGREVIDNPGDFFLSTVAVSARRMGDEAFEGAPFHRAAHSFARSGAPSEMAIDDDEQTSWNITGGTGREQVGVFEFKTPIPGGPGTRLKVVLTHAMYYPGSLGRFRLSIARDPTPADLSTFPAEIEAALTVPAAERVPAQQQALRRYYLLNAPELAAEHARIAALRGGRPALPTTLVMQQRLPQHTRTTRLYQRGEFLKPQAAVEPGVPRVLHEWPADVPHNRLGFARWLVDPGNPLVARVVMNRHWNALFGRGLVRTIEDFGMQGEAPTNPELLDWLATEFMDRGWSQKVMHRLIVTSAVYRQSSQAPLELLDRDPQNLLLARGARFRVDAEIVRDIALASAGLLNPKLEGPSVFAPQPEGITSSAFGALAWKTETGENRYRRGLYTFSKRTAPYAAFATFDAPSGDFCTVRRERSNTPLQALTLLNDAVFVEASQALARRVWHEPEISSPVRLTALFRLCLTRPPTAGELAQMEAFLDAMRSRFRTGELNPAVVGGGTLRKWTFDVDAENWAAGDQCQLAAAEGLIHVTSTGKDSRIAAAFQAPAGPAVLKLRARFRIPGNARIYWLTEKEKEPVESNSVVIEPQRDVWHEYTLDLTAKSDITGLHLALGSEPGETEIDRIELSYSRLPAADVDLTELAAWTALARVLLNLDATITRE